MTNPANKSHTHDYWTVGINHYNNRRLVRCKKCGKELVKKQKRSGKIVHDWNMTPTQYYDAIAKHG